jgi:4'-phosphopantetheinyl transferase
METENLWKSRSIDKELTLEANELHIWRIKFLEDIDNYSDYWNLLTQYEQTQAKSFYFIKDRNRYVVTRAVLRKLLAQYLKNIKPESISLEYTEYGKPYLFKNINAYNINFNLSHSNNCIVYAFTRDIDVGVDIECVNKNFVIEDIIEYCCSEQEKILLQELSNDYKYCYFYKLWVAKEALVKAMGLGLSFDLKRININFDQNKLISVIDVVDNSKLCWTVRIFSAYNGYYSAFATRNLIEKVLFFEF